VERGDAHEALGAARVANTRAEELGAEKAAQGGDCGGGGGGSGRAGARCDRFGRGTGLAATQRKGAAEHGAEAGGVEARGLQQLEQWVRRLGRER
jgi:hypothetical protein